MTTHPRRFRKKPVDIVAVKWDGTREGATRIIHWVLANGGTARYVCVDPVRCEEFDGDCPHRIAIDTIDPSTAFADLNDWIIRGTHGEFYPCKPGIFAATYDPV